MHDAHAMITRPTHWQRWVLGVVLVALVIIVALELRPPRPEPRPTTEYCGALGPPPGGIAMVRLAISRGAPPYSSRPSTQIDLTTLRALGDWLYGPSLWKEGPPGTEGPSRVVLFAIRRAIARGRAAPLDEPATVRALDELRDPVRSACGRLPFR